MMFSISNRYSILSILFVTIFLFSCSTSNDVVSNKLFQKRKYKKGWHKNSSPNYAHKTRKSAKNFVAKGTENKSKDDQKVISTTEKNDISINSVKENESSSEPVIYSAQETVSSGKISKVEKSNYKNVQEIKPSIINEEIEPISNENIESPSIMKDDSDLRILLAILGIIMMIFTTIAPLGVLIALGRGEALRVNLFIYLGAVILAIVGIALLITLGFDSIIVGIVLTASIITWLVSIIHAFVVIIRGH